MPFICGQTWTASTYSGHSPNTNSLDFVKMGGGTSGQPILASASGTVTYAGWDNGGGWMVNLAHANSWGTTYLHMIERPSGFNGQHVNQGQQIGRVGSTGNSSRPHLHYQQWADTPSNTVRAVFDGVQVNVWVGQSQNITSRNCGGGISMAAAPSIAWTSSGNAFYVAALGTDGSIWINDWTADRGYNGWYSIGDGTFTSAPSITWTPNGSNFYVAARANDNAIWVTDWHASRGYAPWYSVGGV